MAIDDASRVGYAQLLSDGDASCAAVLLRAAVAYYAGLGVRIKGVYTYSAKVYRGCDFAEACDPLGLSHHYTRPYSPRTNGKAGRFIQT